MRRLVVLVLALGLVVIIPASPGRARANAASVSVAPPMGPPTSKTMVAGTGFAPGELVDVFFEGADLAVATADESGSFTGANVTIPAAALPGTHWVSAVGRSSGASGQAQFLVRANWRGFHGGPAHTGYNRVENVLSPASVGGLRLAWTGVTGDSVYSSPAVLNGTVFVGSLDQKLHAFDAATGAERWSRTTGGVILSSPTVEGRTVYVGSSDGKLYAFGVAHGTKRWVVKQHSPVVDGFQSSPTLEDGVLYIASEDDDSLYAFDAETGGVRWSAPLISIWNIASPTVEKGIAYIVGGDGRLHAFDAATGAALWSAGSGLSIDTVAVANGRIYAGGQYPAGFYAFDALTGALLWTAAVPRNILHSTPAVANGVVYVGCMNGKLYAFHAATGSRRWAAATGRYIASSPVVANGVVYVGSSDGNLYAFDASGGTTLWSAPVSTASWSLAVVNGFLYFGSFDNNLHAYSLGTPSETPRPDQAKPLPDPTLQAQ
jgi:outer membrane protein assembly factor BamB